MLIAEECQALCSHDPVLGCEDELWRPSLWMGRISVNGSKVYCPRLATNGLVSHSMNGVDSAKTYSGSKTPTRTWRLSSKLNEKSATRGVRSSCTTLFFLRLSRPGSLLLPTLDIGCRCSYLIPLYPPSGLGRIPNPSTPLLIYIHIVSVFTNHQVAFPREEVEIKGQTSY